MDLFESGSIETLKKSAPLADRMRPQKLSEFVGQEHIIGKGRLLRRAIEIDQLSSIILYGPPGTGKTTLAKIIANSTNSEFLTINAVLAGVKDIREAIEKATSLFKHYSKKTILFVDEVHRFNKSQQDALLPHVESGRITLIGATTENPYFEVNKALVSRSRIFQLRSLDSKDLKEVVAIALNDDKRGYGTKSITLNDNALVHLCETANGDARTVLNALELAVETTEENDLGQIVLTQEIIEESIQQKAVLYDKDGDAHYDIISAFIKSIRGSDPDASLYWLAKMIYAGEDPKFILRRMVISAAEDIGMADPNALNVVMSAVQAYDFIGMPEGRFPLAQACLYLATAPKSNTTLSLFDALKSVKDEGEGEVPNHLKDSSRDRQGFGHGEGYLYPHAYRDHWVAQQYLPGELQGKMFYTPSDQGFEASVKKDVERRRETQIAALLDVENSDTFLWQGGSDGNWKRRTSEQRNGYFEIVRDTFFSNSKIESSDLVLDLNGQSGFYTFEALRKADTGGVWSIVNTEDELRVIKQYLQGYSSFDMPELILRTPDVLNDIYKRANGSITFDKIIGRNIFFNNDTIQLESFLSLLEDNGEFFLSEVITQEGSKLSELCENDILREVVESAENHLTVDNKIELFYSEFAEKYNLKYSINKRRILLTNSFARSSIENWFRTDLNNPSLGDVVTEIGGKEICDELKRVLLTKLVANSFPWYQMVAFIKLSKY